MNKYVMPVFWALVVVSVVLVSAVFSKFPNAIKGPLLFTIQIAFITLAVLAVALTVMAARMRPHNRQRIFLLLTGSAGIGLVASLILHNLVFAALVFLFGEDFWINLGDEPFFFVLATLICPLAFLVGAVGSITLWARSKLKSRLTR